MNHLKKKRRLAFWLALCASVIFVACIPLIPVAASLEIPFLLPVAITGCAVGFYGTPLLWVWFGTLCSTTRTVRAITENGLTDVDSLMLQLGQSHQVVTDHIRTALKHRYLTGLFFDGTRLLPLPSPASFEVTCPHCGASVTVTGQEPQCAYCRSVLKLPEI